jgi:hypothetical protein
MHRSGTFSRRLVMDWLERYLHAVKLWLPRAQQDDIVAALSEDIRSEVEEREKALGRTLNEGGKENL